MKKRKNNPVRIAESLDFIKNKFLNKFNKTEYIIYSKWAEIVGAFFASCSKPEKITYLINNTKDAELEKQEATLHVKVTPAAAIEFQHFLDKILDKINSFFGYRAIHRIKIYQTFSSINTHTSITTNKKFDNTLSIKNKKKNEINDTIQKINDKELSQSLFNLGLSVVKHDKN